MDSGGTRLPECKWGANCYRINPEHLLEFWHPTSGTQTNQSNPHEDSVISLIPADASPQGPIEKKDLILLMLVGPPGSGKSTWCQKLIQDAARPWTRICQDVISNGKRGSKAQCLKIAGTALSEGRSVLIDRCNINVDQRKEFLQLAKERNIEAHALVINLPLSVCIQRAVQRTGHEGGLSGPGVGAVVTRVSQERIPPNLGEGFVRITYCRTDTEIQKSLMLYSHLDLTGHLPLGIFGASVQEGKGNLRSYFGNVGKDSKLKSTGDHQVLRASSSSQSLPGQIRTTDNTPLSSCDATTLEKGEEMIMDTDKDKGMDGARSLAFPSISTADFQFDHEMAATIIVETAAEFHKNQKCAGLRLVLTDLSANLDMLSRVSKKATEAGLSSLQLLTHAGDITTLFTSKGPQCNFIANATNWRLKPGGGGVNAAIFKAAGYELEQATKEVAKTLKPGDAVAVPVPATSPLRRIEGVTHVIHVLGPNMNPQRPNCLAGDYNQGCQLLRTTYRRLFQTFSSLVKKELDSHLPSIGSAAMHFNGQNIQGEIKDQSKTCVASKAAPQNAFTMLMQAAKRKGTGDLDLHQKRERAAVIEYKNGEEESTKRDADIDMLATGASSVQESGEGSRFMTSEVKPKRSAEVRAARKWGSWAQALRDIAFHPEKHSPTPLQVTEEAVVIVDQYAKSKKHLLVVARRDGLDTIEDVERKHLPLLKHLHSLGESWARKYINEDPTWIFRLGYHWVPSMRQLHMHVISQDFDSPNLKNKKHWNSFTTGFFRDSQDVLNEVEEKGQVMPCDVEIEGKFMNLELRCHRCRSAQPNIPRLKAHLQTCKATLERPYLVTSVSAGPQ